MKFLFPWSITLVAGMTAFAHAAPTDGVGQAKSQVTFQALRSEIDALGKEAEDAPHEPARSEATRSRIVSLSVAAIQVTGMPRFSKPRNQISCRRANLWIATLRS